MMASQGLQQVSPPASPFPPPKAFPRVSLAFKVCYHNNGSSLNIFQEVFIPLCPGLPRGYIFEMRSHIGTKKLEKSNFIPISQECQNSSRAFIRAITTTLTVIHGPKRYRSRIPRVSDFQHSPPHIFPSMYEVCLTKGIHLRFGAEVDSYISIFPSHQNLLFGWQKNSSPT